MVSIYNGHLGLDDGYSGLKVTVVNRHRGDMLHGY